MEFKINDSQGIIAGQNISRKILKITTRYYLTVKLDAALLMYFLFVSGRLFVTQNTVLHVPTRHRRHACIKMRTALHTGVCLHPPLRHHNILASRSGYF